MRTTRLALFLYLAALRIGAVYVPLNPAYTPAEVEYFLKDAEPRAVVCRPEDEARARAFGVGEVLTLGADGWGSLVDRCAAEAEGLADPELADDDLAAILYTSGTTGRSKGAMLTHGNLAANGLTLAELWDFRATDVLLHALPIFHAHGLFVAIHCTLLAGARMLFLPRFDAEAVLRLMPRATVLMGVPTFYTRLLREPGLTRGGCANMRLFISGSAPLLGGDASAISQPHRSRDPRALRHDRDRHEHLESTPGRARPRLGRAAAAGRRGADCRR